MNLGFNLKSPHMECEIRKHFHLAAKQICNLRLQENESVKWTQNWEFLKLTPTLSVSFKRRKTRWDMDHERPTSVSAAEQVQWQTWTQALVLPWPPVANFVPSGWISTENMGLPVKHKNTGQRLLMLVKSQFYWINSNKYGRLTVWIENQW